MACSGDLSVLVVFDFNKNCFSGRFGLDASISSVRDKICEEWNNFTPLCFDIFYIRESKTTVVETDSDLQAILCLSYFKKEEFLVFFL